MINLTQVILVVVITTLTILLTFIGIQVVYILKDLRETLQRVNKIVDHAETISSAIVRPITGISSLVEGIQSSLKIAELLGYIKSGAKKAASELPGRFESVKQEVSEAKREVEEQLHELQEETPASPTENSSDFRDMVAPVKPQNPLQRFFHRSGTPLG